MSHESTQTGRVQGSPLFDEMGERIGSIVELTIDKMAGQVCEVLLEVGGFLGVGATRCSLPSSALTYRPRLNGYVVARARATPDRSVDEPALSPQMAFDANETLADDRHVTSCMAAARLGARSDRASNRPTAARGPK